MNNLLLGFGVKQINYFTYWTKCENSSTAEYFIDGASFVNYHGEKTPLYYQMQEIMANNQKFAPVIKQFAYQGCRVYITSCVSCDTMYTEFVDNTYTFNKLKNVVFDKEIGFVSELYDKENKHYLYMLMNVVGGWLTCENARQNITATFDKKYTHAVVYKNGVGVAQKLHENQFSVSLLPGEAVFVLPY